VSFFEDVEIDTLRVEKMIIHLVDRSQDFVPQPETPVQQEEFFRSRIIEQASSAVHSFTVHSQVRPTLTAIGRGELGFEEGGQQLAQRFWQSHVRQSTSGAFFVFQLSTGIAGDILFALIKYDYRAVVELAQREGRNVLREIIQAFIKDRKAVQKFCLARFRNGEVEAVVSATDRMADAPDLTDYFASYLGVSRSRDTDELSQRLNEALRTSFNQIRDYVPDRDVGRAMARAKEALRSREVVTNEDFVDAILHGANRPAEEQVRAEIERVARRRLSAGDLTGVEFKPDPRVLAVRPRHRVRTAELVSLEFPEEELGRSVERTQDGQEVVFTIRTQQIVLDDTLPIRTR